MTEMAVKSEQEMFNSRLWKLSQAREMFMEHRLWPSFVGVQNTSQNNAFGSGQSTVSTVGLVPVLLWPEQETYLKEKLGITPGPTPVSSSSSSSNRGDRKRARVEEGETASGDDDVTKVKSKSVSLKTHLSRVSNKRTKIEDIKSTEETEEQDSEADNTDNNSLGSLPIQFLGSIYNLLAAPFNAFSSLLPNVPNTAFSSSTAGGIVTAKETGSGSGSADSYKLMSNADYQMTIFRRCQDLGYFVGPGDVYGGDYNIYRGGDPRNSHSTATIRVVRRRVITGRDLLSFSRVQNQVAKSAVLGYVDPDSKKSEFLVVNFRNVSERI